MQCDWCGKAITENHFIGEGFSQRRAWLTNEEVFFHTRCMDWLDEQIEYWDRLLAFIPGQLVFDREVIPR